METDFLTLNDESHFASFTSPIYENGMLDDSESSLMGIIKDEFPYGTPENCPSFWDTEPELNDSFNCSSFEPSRPEAANSQEDFQKMLTDWQEHLGSLQASDNEDIDMSMSLSRQTTVSQQLPDNIFENDSIPEPTASRSLLKPKQERLNGLYGMKVGGRDARLPIMEDSCSGEDSSGLLLSATAATSLNMQLHLDDEDIDIETVTEQNPVLEAGDVKSLLEQFEASEAVNTCGLQPLTPKLATLQQTASPALALVLSHQRIREALPQLVIDKIKASSRKKVIPVIPAMPSKRLCKGTRMQDAAVTLSRNKLLKLVSGSAGDTVQLDHDYCTTMEISPSVNFYHCDSNEYSSQDRSKIESRIIDFTRTDKKHKHSAFKEHVWEKIGLKKGAICNEKLGGKKDFMEKVDQSGCQTAKQENDVPISAITENSVALIKDKSENLVEKSALLDDRFATVNETVKRNFEKDLVGSALIVDPIEKDDWKKQSEQDCWEEKNAKKDSGLESGEVSDASEGQPCSTFKVETSQPQVTKKKLNLEEYRSRREELEKQRAASRPIPAAVSEEPAVVPPIVVDTTPPAQQKPEMHSVEVQTQDPIEETSRSREQRSRRYRSRRSSGHVSSSSSSCSPHWTHQTSRHRRRARAVPTEKETNSRSPSLSQSSSCPSSPSRSRSRSRSRAGIRQYRGPSYSTSHRSNTRTPDWKRGSSSTRSSISSRGSDWQLTEREREKQVEERRVIYVGRLPEGTTKSDLRKRFEIFGTILDISVHFRERGDNYGFVTFAYKVDAYEAVEHGNDNKGLPIYDLCFGGRRTFCKVRYSDLDAQSGAAAANRFKNNCVKSCNPIVRKPTQQPHESFDHLLRDTQQKMLERGKL